MVFMTRQTQLPHPLSTRVLSPKVAVSMAAVLNILGALSGTAVAKMVGAGLVETSSVTRITVISALLSAIIWDLITWYVGLPTSSSHTILSSIVGAAIATAGTKVIIQKGVYKVLAGLIISPLVGFALVSYYKLTDFHVLIWVGGNIIIAWILTIPACVFLAWAICKVAYILPRL